MMNSTRLREIHADPSSATPTEIQSLAQDAHDFARTRATKTLRDEFAMAALTGLISHFGNGEHDLPADAYLIADAMLGARGK